jgi:hypothetical protein
MDEALDPWVLMNDLAICRAGRFVANVLEDPAGCEVAI